MKYYSSIQNQHYNLGITMNCLRIGKGLLLAGVILSFMVDWSRAETFHFVSVKSLVEQQVGQIIVAEIFEKMGHAVSISPMPGKRAQEVVASGEKDGEIMQVYSYGEQSPTIIRVPTPYYQLETRAFIRKDKSVVVNVRDDLYKYSLARVRGVKFTANITQDAPDVFDLKNTETMMEFLNRGRADIALANTIDGILVLNRQNYQEIIPMDQPLDVLDLYIYLHEKHAHMVDEVDKMIMEMKNNGELMELVKKAEDSVIFSD